MAVSDKEAPRKPWVIKPSNLFFRKGQAGEEEFLDDVSQIAVKNESEVKIRDFTRADNTGKDYWGPDISVLTLAEARQRVSPEALEQRIENKRHEITKAESEIGRLQDIQHDFMKTDRVHPLDTSLGL